MYSYSPIKTFRVKNFRNIGSVDIDFTQCPIVTLLGENESGKTSLIKAFSMCALHDNPREQKDYIRDGTKMLGIEINLEDGTQVVRVKEANGINLYRVIKPDGTVWDTNKITDGLPKEVQAVMGLISEPETGEYLHVRTYEDKLLLVVTPSSTNYKVMYNALKVEQLTKAIKEGSTEVNELKSKVNINNNSIVTLHEQLKDIKVYDVESLITIRERITVQLTLLEKFEKVVEIKQRIDKCNEELGALRLIQIYQLESLSENLASKLNNISRLLNKIVELSSSREKYNNVQDIEEINIGLIEKISNLTRKMSILSEKTKEAEHLEPINGVSEVSENIVVLMGKVRSRAEQIEKKKKQLSEIDTSQCAEISDTDISSITRMSTLISKLGQIKEKQTEVEQCDQYIGQIEVYLKQCGVAVEICPNCGEQVIFDIDKM